MPTEWNAESQDYYESGFKEKTNMQVSNKGPSMVQRGLWVASKWFPSHREQKDEPYRASQILGLLGHDGHRSTACGNNGLDPSICSHLSWRSRTRSDSWDDPVPMHPCSRHKLEVFTCKLMITPHCHIKELRSWIFVQREFYGVQMKVPNPTPVVFHGNSGGSKSSVCHMQWCSCMGMEHCSSGTGEAEAWSHLND